MSQDGRDLSCFFCRELFSLYLEKNLDGERLNQVERHLKSCSACAGIFEKIKESQRIILELAKTKPTDSLVKYLQREHHFWTDFFEQLGWKRWPATLKWAMELSALASVLAVSIHFFPWLNLVKSLKKAGAVSTTQVAQQAPEGKPLPETLDADGIENVAGEVQGPQRNSKSQIAPNAAGNIAGLAPGEPAEGPAAEAASATVVVTRSSPVALVPSLSPVPVAKVAPVPKRLPVTAVTEAAKAAEVADSEKSTETATGDTDNVTQTGQKETGYVWKGTLKVDDLTDSLTDRVTKIIEDLGGVKAGQVELGWHQNDDRYYHFILPEENYDNLLRALNEVGIVELTKQHHPRVIKEGHMRIIMTMEESE